MTELYSIHPPFDLFDFFYVPIRTSKDLSFFAVEIFSDHKCVYSLVKYNDVVIMISNSEKDIKMVQLKLYNTFVGGKSPNIEVNFPGFHSYSYELCLSDIDEKCGSLSIYNKTHKEQQNDFFYRRDLANMENSRLISTTIADSDNNINTDRNKKDYDRKIKEKYDRKIAFFFEVTLRDRDPKEFYRKKLPFLPSLSLAQWDYLISYLFCKWIEYSCEEKEPVNSYFIREEVSLTIYYDPYTLRIAIILFVYKEMKLEYGILQSLVTALEDTRQQASSIMIAAGLNKEEISLALDLLLMDMMSVHKIKINCNIVHSKDALHMKKSNTLLNTRLYRIELAKWFTSDHWVHLDLITQNPLCWLKLNTSTMLNIKEMLEGNNVLPELRQIIYSYILSY